MQTIAFSPHPDDVVFSLGACLLAGVFPEPCVINVYTRSRYRVDSVGSETEVTRCRQIEDREALGRVGIVPSDWGYRDTSLKPQYPDEDAYLDPRLDPRSDPSWPVVSPRIADVFDSHPAALYLAPLGLGDHIDHRVVTGACLPFVQRGFSVLFYEEASYSGSAMSRAECLGLESFVAIRPIKFEHKEALARAYLSQCDDDIVGSLRRAYEERGGERLWSTRETVERVARLATAAGLVSVWTATAHSLAVRPRSAGPDV